MQVRFFIVLTLSLLVKLTIAQNFTWVKQIGEKTTSQSSRSVATDDSGNVFTVGSFKGKVDFDPGTGNYFLTSISEDVFISKLNASGKLVWVKTIGSAYKSVAKDIVLDKKGKLHILGEFTGKLDFNPGSSTYYLGDPSNDYMFVLTLNPDGNFIWAEAIKAVGEINECQLQIDNIDGIYIAGYYRGGVDFNTDPKQTAFLNTDSAAQYYFILKLDTSGKFKWVTGGNGSGISDIFSLTIDNQNNCIVTGRFDKTMDFDPDPSKSYKLSPRSSPGTNMFVLKLSSSGKFVWAKLLTSCVVRKIISDIANNVIISGVFGPSADFDPNINSDTLTSNGEADNFVLKLDSSGKYLWSKSFGNSNNFDNINDLSINDSGLVVITGEFRDSCDFDPGKGVLKLYAGKNTINVFVLTLDKAGSLIGAVNIGRYGYVSKSSVAINKYGDIYLTGAFADSADFDPGTSNYSLKANGYSDIFILKLASCKAPPKGNVKISGVNTACYKERIIYSVGKVTDAYRYSWKLPVGAKIFKGLHSDTVGVDFDTLSGLVIATPYNSCGSGMSDTLRVKINPYVKIKVSFPSYGICSGDGVQLSVKGATSYKWSPSAGLNDSTGSAVTASPMQNTHYSIVGVSPNYCADTGTISVFVYPRPQITALPSSQFLNVGDSAIFRISTLDSFNTYQWQIDTGKGFKNAVEGSGYVGVLNDTLIIRNIRLAQNNFRFRCMATSPDGCSSFSNIDTLLVYCKVSFKQNPLNKNSKVGSTVKFSTVSNNYKNFFQWQINTGKGFINLIDNTQFSGSQKDTLTLKDVKYSQNGNQFRCIINNGTCFDTSLIATLNVECSLTFSKQPANYQVNIGKEAFFHAKASSALALYQWQENTGNGFKNIFDGNKFSGVTNDTLTLKNINFSQNKTLFRCIIIEDGCVDSSKEAMLMVNCVKDISQQPQNQTSNQGKQARFVTTVKGNPWSFQWQINSGGIFTDLSNSATFSGVTKDTLTVNPVNFSQNKSIFRCLLKYAGCEDTTQQVELFVECSIKMLAQPQNMTAKEGSSIFFNVDATGQKLQYQWQENNQSRFSNISNSSAYNGATNDTLFISDLKLAQNKNLYRCVIEDFGCYDTSETATLTVKTLKISKEFIEQRFKLFPNPTSSFFTIIVDPAMFGKPYSITDKVGRKIMEGMISGESTLVDLQNISSGFYVLAIGENLIVTKIIKQ
jgi:hypothetical protein